MYVTQSIFMKSKGFLESLYKTPNRRKLTHPVLLERAEPDNEHNLTTRADGYVTSISTSYDNTVRVFDKC